MDIHQKIRAIEVLTGKYPLSVIHNHDTFEISWVCECGEVSDGHFITTLAAANKSPEIVVDLVWDHIEAKETIVVGGCRYYWDSFMWREIKSERFG